jgi:hypothetical protein
MIEEVSVLGIDLKLWQFIKRELYEESAGLPLLMRE